jgi:TolB protein
LADGTGQTRLTDRPFVTDYSPSWSPNGRHITFGSTRAGIDNPEVYRIRSDGSGLRRLTRTADGVWDDNPEYSRTGGRSCSAATAAEQTATCTR